MQQAITVGGGEVATVGALWYSLGARIVGSGLWVSIDAAAEITLLGTVGTVAGALAGAGLLVVLPLAAVALLSGDNEQLAHDAGVGIQTVGEITSLPYLLLKTVSSIGSGFGMSQVSGVSDPSAGLKAGAWVGDLALGVLSENPNEVLLSLASSGMGLPGAVGNLQDAGQYFFPPSNSNSQPSPSPGGGTTRPASVNGEWGDPGNGSSILFLPGDGDSEEPFYGSHDNGYSGDGITTLYYQYTPNGNGGSGGYGVDTQNGSQPSGDCENPSDCPSDCASDCTTDCSHDCADCSHECADCSHECSTECSDCCE